MTASQHGAPFGGHDVVLAGARVTLRPHGPETLPALRRWYGDPEVARLSRHRNQPLGADDVDRLVVARMHAAETLAFAIYARVPPPPDDGERDRPTEVLVGSCSLANLDTANAAATFHLLIGEPDWRGRGLGREATALVAAFAFEQLGLERLALTVFSFNEAAIRCYRAVGYREEGRAREAIARDGRRWDEIHMGLLAREWRAAHAGD